MGCLTLNVQRMGGGMSLSASRRGGMSVNVALACPVGLGKWEYLEVADGLLLSNEGEKFLVRKKNKS